MGTNYSVFAFDPDFLREAREWLDELGARLPAFSAAARNPSPREITQILRELRDYTADISADLSTGEWCADICAAETQNPAWTALRIQDYRAEDEPHRFYFSKGWLEVIFPIVERLTHLCGPLLVYADSGGQAIVNPGDSWEDFMRRLDAPE